MDKTMRVKEGLKSLLIVLLSCSAVFLSVRVFQMEPQGDVLLPGPVGTQAQSLSAERGKIAWPMRLAAAIQGDGGILRCAAQYNAQESDALFQKTASLLVEALSSTDAPQQVDEIQWRRALRSAPGFYFDFQGELPFSVLAGWLSEQSCALEGAVRRLVLTVADSQVVLYYQNAQNGAYYVCDTDVVDPAHLSDAVSALTGNGAFFAFESEEYQGLDPYTLLLPEAPEAKVYRASNPLAQEADPLGLLMEELYFPSESAAFYTAGDERVARNGEESMRLSQRGVVTYQCDDEDSGRYLIAHEGETATLLEMAEGCRALAQRTLGSRCGQARLYLMGMEETPQGWQVEFGCCIDGIPVQTEEGCTARFLVRNGQILEFSLWLRGYAETGETALLLPEGQAMAAMESLGHAGEELVLIYPDQGGESILPVWAAAGTLSGAEKEG